MVEEKNENVEEGLLGLEEEAGASKQTVDIGANEKTEAEKACAGERVINKLQDLART